MQRSGPTKSDQREFPRVMTLLDRNETQGAAHVLVDDINNTRRSFFQWEVQRIGYLLYRFLRQRSVKLHITAKTGKVRQISQAKIGIGHRRLLAALPVTCGPRISAGAAAEPEVPGEELTAAVLRLREAGFGLKEIARLLSADGRYSSRDVYRFALGLVKGRK